MHLVNRRGGIVHGRAAAERERAQHALALDFLKAGLLDRDGQLLGNPVHYRDERTQGMMEAAFQRVPRAEVESQLGPLLAEEFALSAAQQAAIGFACGGTRATLGRPVVACSGSDYRAELVQSLDVNTLFQVMDTIATLPQEVEVG